MVKLVSFLVFTVAFIWSWFLFHSKSNVGIGIHAGIQSKLAVIIEDAIHKARPNAYNFQMITLYTKNVEENKISAYFTYRYSEKLEEKEHSDQTVKGEAVLNRAASEIPDEQKWVIQSVKTDDQTIEFRDGSVISSGDVSGEDTDAAATAPEGTAPAAAGNAPGSKAAATSTPAPAAQPANAPATEEKKTE
jgi:hypothetical protein